MNRVLHPQPLTQAEFAPFGDVIETTDETMNRMNEGRFERFESLSTIEMAPPESAKMDIVRCLKHSDLPYRIDMLERHPLGTQAFLPLTPFVFAVVVAPAGDTVEMDQIKAFLTDGYQGINYHRGTWHMPMIAFSKGNSFLVIDRGGNQPNCEEFRLPAPIVLSAAPIST